MSDSDRGSWRSRQQASNNPASRPDPQVEKASWRKKGAAGAAAPRKASTWWSRHHEQDVKRPLYYRRIRLALIGLAFMGLVALFIVTILPRYKTVPLIGMVVTRYDQDLIPPNAYTQEDAQNFARLFRRAENISDRRNVSFWGDYQRAPTQENYWSQISRHLDQVLPGGPNQDVILFYVSAHGVVDERGRPCLLLHDAHPWDSSSWLPVQDLLERLKTVGQTEGVKKILLLDAGRIEHDWNMGLLYNGFADALPAAVEQVNDPRLVVLNSAGPGQQAWTAPELQGSVFGHFVAAGLHGYADANRDEEITLAELVAYLERKVSSWVREHRDSMQHPMLVARGQSSDWDRWQLAYTTVSPAQESKVDRQTLAAAQDRAQQQSEDIQQLWQQTRDLMAQQDPQTLNPLDWAKLQWMLQRLERLMLAGKAYQQEFATTREQAEVLLRSFADAHRLREEAVFSLPLREQLSDDLDNAQRRQSYLHQWSDVKTRAAAQRQWGYATAAAVGWEWLKQETVSVDDLREVLDMVSKAQPQPSADLIEIHTLRMLYKHLSSPEAIGRAGRVIAVRDLAERAAAPPDVRAHYWVQALVERADQARRAAEDQLFIETDAALAQADQAWQRLLDPQQSDYHQGVILAEQVSAAYHLRDLAWATAPYYADWLQTGLRNGSVGADRWALLYEMIDASHELARQLDDGAGQPDQAAWTAVQPSIKRLQQALDQLQMAYSEQVAELFRAGVDQHTLRDAGALLSLPLLSPGDAGRLELEYRSELRRRYLQELFSGGGGDDRLPADPRVAKDLEADRQAETSANDAYLTTLAERAPHPLLALLDMQKLQADEHVKPAPALRAISAGQSESLRADQLKLLSSQGQEARRMLQETQDGCRSLVQLSKRRLDARDFSVAEVRAGFSRADRLARAAAVGLGGRPWFDASEDPALLLRKLDRHYQFLWHARRSLDDFWGPKEEKSEPYFLIAVQSYLSAAQQWARQDDSDIRQLLEQRQAAAAPNGGLRPQTDDVRFSEDQEFVDHQIALEQSPGLPAGQAAVFLRPFGRSGQRLEVFPSSNDPQAIRSFGVSLGSEALSPLRYRISKTGFEETTMLEAVALFRGHVRSDQFPVAPAGPGDEVLVLSHPEAATQVTVFGDQKSPGVILFVFDCSGSMDYNLQVRDLKAEVDKFVVARSAISEILKRLPNNDYRVGLMVYGHSSRGLAKTERPRYSNPDRTYLAPDGQRTTQHPNEAVELLIPPRELLDANLRARIDATLAGLRPWGQTPLYRSLREALAEFDRIGPASTKHIVVLTDGLDDQLPSGPRVFAKDVTDLLGQPTYRDVRIDIVGLDTKKLEAAEPGKAAELRRIASRAGGAYHDQAQDPSSLLAALADALKPLEYTVQRTGDPAPLKQLPLGDPWFVTLIEPAEHTVRLLGTERQIAPHKLLLEGGENIELYYDRPANQLVHRRYAPQFREAKEVSCTREQEFYVSTFMPTRNGNEVTFYVSVQNDQEFRFSPRPQRVWCEITPVDYDVQPTTVPTYHFYDLEFQEAMPVPVLVFRVPNWPQSARRARLNIWFALDDVLPTSLNLNEIGSDWFTVAGVSNTEFRVERENVAGGGQGFLVRQRHGSSASEQELYGARVQMSPTPDQIFHRYIADVPEARHLFRYGPSRRPERLEITPRDRVVQGSVTLTQPVTVVPERR